VANFVLDKGYFAASNYASSDVNGVQAFRGVRLTAAQTIDRVSASTQLAVGVVQESVDVAKVATGKVAVDVRVQGISRCTAGAAIAIGAEVMFNAVGKVITAATTGNRVCGVALQAAGADNDQIDVELIKGGRLIP
jgi:hypothetical protein